MSGQPVTPAVAIVSGVKGDTRRYRTLHLHQQLRMAGVPASVHHLTDPEVLAAAGRCDLLIVHRAPLDRTVTALVDRARQRGAPALLDADDLTFDLDAFQWIDSPDFKDPVRANLYRQELLRQKATLDLCDGAITSTDYLAEIVRRQGKPAWVHRNAANAEMLAASQAAMSRKRPADGKWVIGYASGTPTHNRDFALITPALIETLQAHPQAELWIIGHLALGPEWAAWQARIRRFAPVPWRDLPAWLAQIDLNLAPLALDNPFSQSKSEIKYMEAALVGVPTLASATDAFRYAIRSGENGWLAVTPEEWSAGLSWMADPQRRAAIGAAARQDALARYSPQRRARDAVQLLAELGAHFGKDWRLPQGEPEAGAGYNWPIEWENHPTNLQAGLYSLRTRGPLTLGKQIWITLRRAVTPWFPF